MKWRAIHFNRKIYQKPMDAPEEMKEFARVNIKLFLPPSDVPNSIDHKYDKEKDLFQIAFRYWTDEKETKLFEKDKIRLFVGNSSGRPSRIEIEDVRKNNVDQIQLKNIITRDLSRLIESKIEGLSDLRKRANLRCADEILQESAEELAQSVEI